MKKLSLVNLIKATFCLGLLGLIGILSAFGLGGKPSAQTQADTTSVEHVITISVAESKTGCDINSVVVQESAGFSYDAETRTVKIAPSSGKASFIVNLTLADGFTADLTIASTRAEIRRNSLTQFVVTINGTDKIEDNLEIRFGDAHKFTLSKEFAEIANVTSTNNGFYFNKQLMEVSLLTNAADSVSFVIIPTANKYYKIIGESFQTNEEYFRSNGITYVFNEDESFTVTIAGNSTKLSANIKIQAEPVSYTLNFECTIDGNKVQSPAYIEAPTAENIVKCGETLFRTQDQKYNAKTIVETIEGSLYATSPIVFNRFAVLDTNGRVYKTISNNYEGQNISEAPNVTIDSLLIDTDILDNCLTSDGKLNVVALYREATVLQLEDIDLSKYTITINWTGWYYILEEVYYVEKGASIGIDFTRQDKHTRLETINKSVMSEGGISDLPEEQVITEGNGNYTYSFIIPDDCYLMTINFGINAIEYEIEFTCFNESIGQDIEEGPIQLILGEGAALEYKAPYNGVIAFSLEDEIEGYEFKYWVITKHGGNQIVNGQSGSVIIDSEDYLVNGKITIKAYFTQKVGVEVKIPTTYRNTSVDYKLYTVNGDEETLVDKTTSNRYQFYYGTKIKLVATSSEYIEFVSYVINNNQSEQDVNLVTVVTEDSQILINFKNVDVAYNFESDVAGAKGKLEVSSDTISIGKALIISFNSNAGYSVSDWKINGKAVDEFTKEINANYGNVINYSDKSNTLTIRANEAFIEYLKKNGLQTSVTTSINTIITVAVLGGAVLIVGSLLLIIVLVFINAKKKKQMATADQVATSQSRRIDNDYLQRLREGKE